MPFLLLIFIGCWTYSKTLHWPWNLSLPMHDINADAMQQKDYWPDYRQNNHNTRSFLYKYYNFPLTAIELFITLNQTTLSGPSSCHFLDRERQGKYRCHRTIFPSPYGRKRQLYHWYSYRRKSPIHDTSPSGSSHNLWAHGT